MKNPSQFKSKVIIAQDFPLDHFDVDKCILLYDKVFESKELDAVVAMTFIEQILRHTHIPHTDFLQH